MKSAAENKTDPRDLVPTEVKAAREDGGPPGELFYTIPADTASGFRLAYNVRDSNGHQQTLPLRVIKACFYRGLFSWKPYPDHPGIAKLEGEGISADGRFQYPDRNRWGVIIAQGSRIRNMIDDVYLMLDFDKNLDIIVNVNDLKNGYADNTGYVKFAVLAYGE